MDNKENEVFIEDESTRDQSEFEYNEEIEDE